MDNEQLVARIQAGEDEPENMLQLWQQNRGFIAKIARQYAGRAEVEDLEQEGYIGLYEAVRHYEPDKGVPFINYAAFWIRQAMKRYIENCAGVVRIPSHMADWLKKYGQAVNEYQKEYHERPSDGALCWLLGIGREKLQAIREAANMAKIGSLNASLQTEDGDLAVMDTVASGEDLEEDACRRLDRERLERTVWVAVDRLPGDQPAILRMVYQDGMTRIETGKALGYGNGKVSLEERKALKTIRNTRKGRAFRAYYEEYLSAAPSHHIGVSRFRTTWTSEVEQEALGY